MEEDILDPPPDVQSPVRLPPHSIPAETCVLGAMLIDPPSVSLASRMLKASDFYRPEHQEIFAAILALSLANIGVDLVTLREKLMSLGLLGSVGGVEYLLELVKGVPTATNLRYYADIVRAHARRRDLIVQGASLAADGHDLAQEPGEVIRNHMMKLHELSLGCEDPKEDCPVGAAVDGALATAEKIEKDPASRLLFGFADIDSACGGFLPGEVVVLGGRQSEGKSALASNIAVNLARAGRGVLYVSGEMPAGQIGKRLLQAQGQIWGSAMRTGKITEQDWENAYSAGEAMRPWKLHLIGQPMTIPQIGLRARQLRAQWHGQLDLIVIDYLQIMRPHEGRTIREQIMAISRYAKQTALELGVCVLLLSQFARPAVHPSGKPAGPPSVYELKESGTIEQDADFVLLLHQPDQQPAHTGTDCFREVWLRVGKGRESGQTEWPKLVLKNGEQDTGIRLRFYPGLVLFSDWMRTLNEIPRLQGPASKPVWERSGRQGEPIGSFLARFWHKIVRSEP